MIACTLIPRKTFIHIFIKFHAISVTAEVNNASNVKVDRLQITLRKSVVFKTNSPRRDLKKEKTIIAEFSIGPVDEHSEKHLQQNIEIPPLPPSNLINCSLIDLDYELKVHQPQLHYEIYFRISSCQLNHIFQRLFPHGKKPKNNSKRIINILSFFGID